MKRVCSVPATALATFGLVLLGVSGPAVAQEEGKHRAHVVIKQGEGSGSLAPQVIEIHKRHCEGDGCAADDHAQLIFLGEDGAGPLHLGENGGLFEWSTKGGFLGVQLTELTPALRVHFGVPEGSGIMISEVVSGSAAEKAGLKAGDIITAVDGKDMASAGALRRAVRGHEPGETVQFELWRDGILQPTSAVLDKQQTMPSLLHTGDGPEGNHFIWRSSDDNDGEADVELLGDGKLELLHGIDCGGADECRIEISCDGGNCSCTINGETTDCEQFPRFK